MVQPLRVAVVGCGTICDQYLSTLSRLGDVTVVAVADLDHSRAEAAAARYATVAVAVDDLYRLPEVEWVLNLTTPQHHLAVAMAAVEHGRSVYTEKPMCVSFGQAQSLLDAARAAGVAVACAPDTVLGTGVQTARRAIADGLIGCPIAATATMATPGHELWHPAPDFYYTDGGGPLFDMGPYYLSALVSLVGPVVGVTGVGSRSRANRTIATGPRAGTGIPVTVDTHVTALLRHASGALTTLVVSFDMAATRSANIEVHGALGSLIVPDPNMFDGQVLAHEIGGAWTSVPVSAGYLDAGRGCGLADIARSSDRATARASAELALHVLDVMECVLASAAAGGAPRATRTGCVLPDPVPLTRLA